MIIIRRYVFIILGVFVVFFCIGFGFYAYRQFLSLESSGVGGVRFEAERLLFFGFVSAIVILLLYVGMLSRAVSLDHRLDRLIERGRDRDIAPGRDFAKLGRLGEKLTVLFNQLSHLNYKKSQKISAMAALQEFLVRNQEKALVVTDVTGTVLYVSETLISRSEFSRNDVLDSSIEKIVEGLSVTSLVVELLRLRAAVEGGTGKTTFTCYPLEDRSDELTYLVFLFGAKAEFFEVRKPAGIGSRPKPRTATSRFRNFRIGRPEKN